MWRVLAVAGVAVMVSTGSGAAAAAPVIGEGPYKLTESDGKLELTITASNDTGEEMTFAITGRDDGCAAAGDEALGAMRSGSVKFSLPDACDLSDEDEIELTLTATGSGGVVSTDSITAKLADDKADPDYRVLLAYAGAAAIAAILVRAAMGKASTGWATALPGITEKWSISDSWATNAGLVTALFTAIFGATDILEVILGEDAKSELAVAAVAAAVTATLIGVTPAAIQATRTRTVVANKPKYTVRAGGVALASWLVVTANVGIIWTLVLALTPNGDVSKAVLIAVAAIATIATLVHGFTNTRWSFQDGQYDPHPADDADKKSLGRTTALL